MTIIIRLFVLTYLLNASLAFAQNNEATPSSKEFTSITEALLNPEKVRKLNLSDQTISLSNDDWMKFTNLESLNLKNDHLKELPLGITTLKSLKTIDLSGNDFSKLPDDFNKLLNLEEVFLNDEKNLNLPKTLKILVQLPKLKSLHLENDNIKSVPNEILNFKNLEYLYLNNNKLTTIPKIQTLDHLKYLDLKDNKINTDIIELKNINFGFKINL